MNRVETTIKIVRKQRNSTKVRVADIDGYSTDSRNTFFLDFLFSFSDNTRVLTLLDTSSTISIIKVASSLQN